MRVATWCIIIAANTACLLSITVCNGVVHKPTPLEHLKAKGYDTTDEGLKRALSSPSWLACISALQFIKDEGIESRFEPEVREHAKDQDERIRVLALAVLGSISPDESLVGLRQVVNYGVDERARLDAVEWLVEMGKNEGFELVKDALLTSKTQYIRAATILPKYNKFKDEGVDLMPLLLKGMDRAVQMIGEEDAAQTGIGTLFLRRLVNSVVLLKDERGVNWLVEAQQSPSAKVRAVSKMGLYKLGLIGSVLETTPAKPEHSGLDR